MGGANGGADKLDGFLQRRVTYEAEVVTRSGTTIGDLTGAVTVALTNDVVVAGLPGYVIGSPLRETPQGTNRVHLSIYTPHQLESLSIDGRPVDAELQRELGFNRYLVFAEVAPGASMLKFFSTQASRRRCRSGRSAAGVVVGHRRGHGLHPR